MKALYLLALGLVSAALIAGTHRAPPNPSVIRDGDLRFAAEPAGLDGPAAACVACHSIEKDGPLRVAPTLWNIVGEEKARFRWYGYSKALAAAGGRWSEQELDAYLADPDGFLPGTRKTLIGIADPGERKDLIAFLATLRDPDLASRE